MWKAIFAGCRANLRGDAEKWTPGKIVLLFDLVASMVVVAELSVVSLTLVRTRCLLWQRVLFFVVEDCFIACPSDS